MKTPVVNFEGGEDVARPEERGNGRKAGRNDGDRSPAPAAPDEKAKEWRLLSSTEESPQLLETHHQVMDSYREGTVDPVRDKDDLSDGV